MKYKEILCIQFEVQIITIKLWPQNPNYKNILSFQSEMQIWLVQCRYCSLISCNYVHALKTSWFCLTNFTINRAFFSSNITRIADAACYCQVIGITCNSRFVICYFLLLPMEWKVWGKAITIIICQKGKKSLGSSILFKSLSIIFSAIQWFSDKGAKGLLW